MKIILPALVLALGGCVHSERYGDYHYQSQISYGSGQVIRQTGQGHWQESTLTPPQAQLRYQHGPNRIQIDSAAPAPPPPAPRYYPYHPEPAPAPPYIRSSRSILPGCTRQSRIHHGDQTVIVTQPCQ